MACHSRRSHSPCQRWREAGPRRIGGSFGFKKGNSVINEQVKWEIIIRKGNLPTLILEKQPDLLGLRISQAVSPPHFPPSTSTENLLSSSSRHIGLSVPIHLHGPHYNFSRLVALTPSLSRLTVCFSQLTQFLCLKY